MVQLLKISNRYWITGIVILIVIFPYWFWGKFYPTQTGEWSKKTESNFDESIIPNSGWETTGDRFWTSLDFPGKQAVCLNASGGLIATKDANFTLPVRQASRAELYPEAGTLSDLFSKMAPAQVEERIKQGKPYFIGHLASNVSREGKDLFFWGENEKFLIPTKDIFSSNFPTKNIPEATVSSPSLSYANILIGLPEGVLLSDGSGVFVMSQGKLFLIRSPEVFEAMGYKWENIKQMDNYEKAFNSYLSGNLIDFNAASPNGTILKDNRGLLLVWEEKLYRLTAEEQAEYFPEQPVVETAQKNMRADCSVNSESHKAVCCVSDVDTRLNPPGYNPFLNTMEWDLSQLVRKDEVEKISWQSSININQENTLRRLGSLKNYVLYGLGILK